MNDMGHNENAVRLAALAGDAQIALERVAKGETDANEGWVAYGKALNEGRALFPSNEQFGQWVAENGLSQVGTNEVKRDERIAAMWMAENADQLAEAKAASNARTPRGWHDQWKKIERDRQKAAEEAERKAKQEAEREAARKATEEAKAKQNEARAAAEAAKDDKERKAAKLKAEEAAKAAADAEAKTQEATNKEADKSPDPYAQERKGLAKFTREGVEDELIEARIAIREKTDALKKANAKIREQRKEAAALKERIKELTEEDKNEAIAKLQSKSFRLREQRDENQAKLAKETRRSNFFEEKAKALEKENASLKENQEFTL